MSREFLQELEYRQKGAYHRRAIRYVPFHPSRERYRSALSLLPTVLNTSKILDFGGGDGAFSTFAADKGATVVVFDRDLVALNYARVDKRLAIVQGETYLPFPDRTFDIVAMLETLEHIKSGGEIDALKEIYRVLKPTGLLILTVPSTNLPVPAKHYRHYTADDLNNKLEAVGFNISRQIGYRDPTTWLSRSLPSFLRKPIRGSVYAANYLLKSQLSKSNDKNAHGLLVLAEKPGQLYTS